MKKIQSFLKLPFSFDLAMLKDDLKQIKDEEWVSHPNIGAYDGLWQTTALTSPDGDTKNIVAIENIDYKQTPLLKRMKYIKSVIDTFETKVEAVRFMKLGANSVIKEHCDKGSSFEQGYARLHIPISSNDEVTFILSGKNYQMDLGHCYYIDANNPHGVLNKGDSDRVHLLIDCHVNDWLKEFFIDGGFELPYHKYGDNTINDENVDGIINSLKQINTQISLEMADKLQKIKDSHVI